LRSPLHLIRVTNDSWGYPILPPSRNVVSETWNHHRTSRSSSTCVSLLKAAASKPTTCGVLVSHRWHVYKFLAHVWCWGDRTCRPLGWPKDYWPEVNPSNLAINKGFLVEKYKFIEILYIWACLKMVICRRENDDQPWSTTNFIWGYPIFIQNQIWLWDAMSQKPCVHRPLTFLARSPRFSIVKRPLSLAFHLKQICPSVQRTYWCPRYPKIAGSDQLVNGWLFPAYGCIC